MRAELHVAARETGPSDWTAPSLILMAGVFSALCVTPKALSLPAKFAKTVSRL